MDSTSFENTCYQYSLSRHLFEVWLSRINRNPASHLGVKQISAQTLKSLEYFKLFYVSLNPI